MPYYRKLAGETCYLSPLQTEDAGLWAAWLNDLEVSLPLGDEAYTPLALEKAREEVEGAIHRQDHVFTIVECTGDRPIGRCLLFSIDAVNRSAMLGILIGEKTAWNRGLGTEATRLLLDYAFNLLNLRSVMLGVFAFNRRAIRAYEKVGFQRIGVRREARIIAGKAWGVVLMDILEEEFRERWESIIRGAGE
jgi:RimJ/RimL family protein N-acetyltransferase